MADRDLSYRCHRIACAPSRLSRMTTARTLTQVRGDSALPGLVSETIPAGGGGREAEPSASSAPAAANGNVREESEAPVQVPKDSTLSGPGPAAVSPSDGEREADPPGLSPPAPVSSGLPPVASEAPGFGIAEIVNERSALPVPEQAALSVSRTDTQPRVLRGDGTTHVPSAEFELRLAVEPGQLAAMIDSPPIVAHARN